MPDEPYCEPDPESEPLPWVAWSKRLGQRKWSALAEFECWSDGRTYLTLYCHRRPNFSAVLQRPGERPDRLPTEEPEP